MASKKGSRATCADAKSYGTTAHCIRLTRCTTIKEKRRRRETTGKPKKGKKDRCKKLNEECTPHSRRCTAGSQKTSPHKSKLARSGPEERPAAQGTSERSQKGKRSKPKVPKARKDASEKKNDLTCNSKRIGTPTLYLSSPTKSLELLSPHRTTTSSSRNYLPNFAPPGNRELLKMTVS